MVLETESIQPLLVVECETDLDVAIFGLLHQLLTDLFPSKQPCQGWHLTSQALHLVIVGSNLSHALVRGETKSFAVGVVQARAQDFHDGAAFARHEGWADFCDGDVVVPESQRLASELLSVESYVHVIRQIIWVE